MNISEMLGDSFRYAISDYQKFLIFGVIVVLANLQIIFSNWAIENYIVIISSIISLIFSFVFLGYLVSMVRDTINNIDEMPDLDFGSNIVEGIKAIILTIVYYIIPFIITILVAILTGVFDSSLKIYSIAMEGFASNTTDLQAYILTNVPQTTFETLFISMVITIIVGIILFIIFSIFSTIGFARFAKYKSLSEGLSIGKVFDDIKTIGIGRIIGWIIVLIIIAFVIGFIIGILNMIPYIGVILSYLVGYTYRRNRAPSRCGC